MLLEQRHIARKRKQNSHFNEWFAKSSERWYVVVARDFSYSELLDRDPVNH